MSRRRTAAGESADHQRALAKALRTRPGAMNGQPPTKAQVERSRAQWQGFKDKLRSEGKKDGPSKGGKKSGERRAEWHTKAQTDAATLARDGMKRAEVVGTLAIRYERSKETIRDVLRDEDRE